MTEVPGNGEMDGCVAARNLGTAQPMIGPMLRLSGVRQDLGGIGAEGRDIVIESRPEIPLFNVASTLKRETHNDPAVTWLAGL